MKNKRILLLALTGATVMAATIGVVAGTKFNTTKGETKTYTLSLNRSTNKLTTSETSTSGTANAYTAEGNPVGFSFSGISKASNGWQCFCNSGSYVQNTDPITGLYSIAFIIRNESVTVNVTSAEDSAFTENVKSTSFFSLEANKEYAWTFAGTSPSYFKIESNDANVTLDYIFINYSCAA